MDEQRQKTTAYQYLCHLEEAKKWVESCINEQLPGPEQSEDFRHGVHLAKLANCFDPKLVPIHKIFDADLSRYHSNGVTYRHTDNINYFLKFLKSIGLPDIFHPETVDIFECKNLPRLIFCLHALSLFLNQMGKAPVMHSLMGQVKFSDEVLQVTEKELEKVGRALPQFHLINGMLNDLTPRRKSKLVSLIDGFVSKLNQSLQSGSALETLNALKGFGDHLPPLLDVAASLYHQEMALIRSDAQSDLSLEEIRGGVRFLTCLGNVTLTLRQHGSSMQLWQCLSHTDAHIQGLEKSLSEDYAKEFYDYLQRSEVPEDFFFTYEQLQEIVDRVNINNSLHFQKVQAIVSLNQCLDESDLTLALKALTQPILNLPHLQRKDAVQCCLILKELRSEQLKVAGDADLSLDDIFGVAEGVTCSGREAQAMASFHRSLNEALSRSDLPAINQALKYCANTLGVISVSEISDLSQDLLASDFEEIHAWVSHKLKNGSRAYINVLNGNYEWDRPREPGAKACYMTLKHVVDSVKRVRKNSNCPVKLATIVKFQAVVRGWLVRKKLEERRAAATIIQSWWRMATIRRMYTQYCQALKCWEPKIILIQRAFRKWLQRKCFSRLISHFRTHERQVVALQRAWRERKARHDLGVLLCCRDPTVDVVKGFLPLMEVTLQDLQEELQLQAVREKIVKLVRHIRDQENEVDQLDVKIGLLVQNRLTLQEKLESAIEDKENTKPQERDTLKGKKKTTGKHPTKYATIRMQKGLKALKKEWRDKLLAYQHLFYLLQTTPHYLSRLVFALPVGKTTKFIENVIFALFNYGSNDRDSFLLLRLFRTALEEEIRSRVLRLNDIISGNPMVIRMIITFIRKGTGQALLRGLLFPLLTMVLDDQSLNINTNPVEIYKAWINQLETNTGQPSGYPYAVNQEQALQYPEVQSRLVVAVQKLKEITGSFCDVITGSPHLIPYGMSYMAKILRAALQRRFHHIPDKEILKVVGHLLYYRYINSAIAAPDAFDIVTVSVDHKLNNTQRRNLASIAKILQFASVKKGFGEEASHLACLNPFIVECHEKFRAFFTKCCEVDEPETIYNVTQYSEALLLVKPTVYMTVQEICETHQLLLEHLEVIAPDVNDPLRSLLKELGDKPSVQSLLGEAVDGTAGGRQEVSLTLSPKYEEVDIAGTTDSKDPLRLFNKTKQHLVDMLQCVAGKDIHAMVISCTTAQEESRFQELLQQRLWNKHQVGLPDVALDPSEYKATLHEVKTRLSHNLRRLENQALTSRSNNYQSLLTAITKDIVSQKQRRTSRREEIQRMFSTSSQLEVKENFFSDQLNSYTTYLNTCLANLPACNKNVHGHILTKKGKQLTNKSLVKYSGIRLQEKGVLVDIEELPEGQLKNVTFEISPLATNGAFQVQVKFMGVAMESIQVDIQELLQLQYEGVIVKQMMGRARVNVNLLLHLLNDKFYCKKRH